MIARTPDVPQERALEWRTLGHSVEGREIRVCLDAGVQGQQDGGTLLIGGLHGDETATVLLLEEFCRETLGREVFEHPVAVIPLANPDSYAHHSRYNANGVDLNRNCDHRWSPDSEEPPGVAPWSEPEICVLRDFILEWQPRAVVALHWALAEIDADGAHSRPLAEAMWGAIPVEYRGPYRLRVSDTGLEQPGSARAYTACPGSLGQWCGYALQYPEGGRPAMITLELPYDPAGTERPEPLPADHLQTLRERWQRDSAGYLRESRPAVQAMLLAACRYPELERTGVV